MLKVAAEDEEALLSMERYMILKAIDSQWQEYLRNMDSLRQGVGLRAYGQRDPLVEYKKEAFEMFATLMEEIKEEIANRMFRSATSAQSLESFISSLPQMYVHDEVHSLGAGGQEPARAPQGKRSVPAGADAAMQAALGSKSGTIERDAPKVGRNDPCPCGSGKKYKKCCGAG
jgi:preprotein translocase subunit SecA